MRRNRINNTRELLRIVRSVVVAEKTGVPHVRICLVEPERLDFEKNEVCFDIKSPHFVKNEVLAIRAFISDNKERINFIFSRYCGLVDEKSIAETSVDNDIECVKRFLTELSESIVAGQGKAIFGSFPQLALAKLIAEEIDENRGWSTISKSREMTTQILREITGVLPNVIFEDGSDERCPHPTMLMHLKNGKLAQVYAHSDGNVFVSVEGAGFHQVPDGLSVRKLRSHIEGIVNGAGLPQECDKTIYPYEFFWGGEQYPEWLPQKYNWEDVTGVNLNPRRGLEKVIFNKKLCVNRMVDIRKVDNRYGDIIADVAAHNTVNYLFPGMTLRISEGENHSKIGAVTAIYICLYENSSILRSKTEILPDVFVPQSTLNVGRAVHEIIKLFNEAAESECRFERVVNRMRKDLLCDIPKVAPRTMFRQEPYVND